MLLPGHAPAGVVHSGIPWNCNTNREEQRMDRQKHTGLDAILEQLIERGADDMANVFARMFDLAMRIAADKSTGLLSVGAS